METLPVEIIEHIICCENLSISDVVNFSLTNRYYNVIVTKCNRIWKKEYFKTWPQFVELFDNKFNDDWYAEVRYIYDLKRRTREILSTMSSHFYNINSVLSNSDFTEWSELYQEKPQTYHYLIDDLMNIVNTDVPIQSIKVVPITTPGNKTLQYYAIKVLRYLRQLHLTKEWAAFIVLPQKLQTLEKGIVFVGQWFHPNSVSWQNFATKLDELTEKVRENLRRAHPNHPLFDVPNGQLEMWRNENIECDKYDFTHCMQIKRAMTQIIKEDFARLYSFKNIFCSVTFLEEFNDCDIFLIIYEAVGRRLGLKHEPVVGIRDLGLRSSRNNNSEENYGIDFGYGSYGYGYRPMLSVQKNSPVATTQQVVELIAKQVVDNHYSTLPNRDALERLCSFLKCLDLLRTFNDVIRLCVRYYNTDATPHIRVEYLKQQENQALDQMEPIVNMLQHYETDRHHGGRLFGRVEPKIRPTNLKYAVGMVIKHRSRNLCVICDWDCSASDEEPFYNVLFSNGANLCVKQGELMTLPRIRSSSELLTWCFKDIGKHFSHRFETVFVPNAEKEREYPADAAVRNMYNDQIKPLA